jgi:hypothetical protein
MVSKRIAGGSGAGSLLCYPNRVEFVLSRFVCWTVGQRRPGRKKEERAALVYLKANFQALSERRKYANVAWTIIMRFDVMYLSMGGTYIQTAAHGALCSRLHRSRPSLGAVDSRKPVGGVSVKGGHDNGPVAGPSKLEKSGLGGKTV